MRPAPQRSAGIVPLMVGRQDPAVLQDFLAQRFSLSRRAAKAMIDGRSVWVNRNCVWMAGYRLRVGDRVELPERVVRGATTLDGVKRRAGTGMGRCQGSRCQQKLI
ncbi:MAG: (2Fe-2S)-binding protein, partial [Kiritimatiellae bacterium]|nr:(2Fe-2S)-binding protein [Kiritimatiellia bacterium]